MKKLILFVTVILAAKLLSAQVNIANESFYSQVLQQEMMVDVYLPPGYETNLQEYYPVIYFLHGWGSNQNILLPYASTADDMISNGEIAPLIMVCANNQAGPFLGTMYMNSPLWGDFETYNFTEVVDFIEENFRAVSDKNKRALMGQSMGGSGCFEPGISNKDKFRAIAAHGYSGVFEACLDNWQAMIINEQTSGPPYFYEMSTGGFLTKLAFLVSGAYTPNMNCNQTWINPAIVEYPFDDHAQYIDTILNKWLEHSGHEIVKQLSPDDDFGIFFGTGENDNLGIYPGCVALKDSLDTYGIPATFFSHSGGHAMPMEFIQAAYIFLDSIFNIPCSCLPEGITFTTQEQIDNFQINYPGCIEIEGNLNIAGDDNISNIEGLYVLTTIQGNLHIGDHNNMGNELLLNLNGLDNLTYIGGELFLISNLSLTSIQSLNNLTYIGGDIKMGENWLLESLSGLEGLQSVNGDIEIGTMIEGENVGNPIITSLSGLDSISSITGSLKIADNDNLLDISALENILSISGDLMISGNPLLSNCHIQSICNYFTAPSGSVYISNNAPGCNNQEEVEQACLGVSVAEFHDDSKIIITPNPAIDKTIITFDKHFPEPIEIIIYNTLGRCISKQKYTNDGNAIQLKIANYTPGIYLCRIMIGNVIINRKIIKQ